MAQLASTSRSQRAMARQVDGPMNGDVLWWASKPNYRAVGRKGRKAVVRVPMRVRELDLGGPRRSNTLHLPLPVLDTVSRTWVEGALWTAVEHYHAHTDGVLAHLKMLHRGLRAERDPAERDVRVFSRYVQTRPTLSAIKASLDDVLDRLSTRGLYMIYYAYTLHHRQVTPTR